MAASAAAPAGLATAGGNLPYETICESFFFREADETEKTAVGRAVMSNKRAAWSMTNSFI